MKRTALLTAEKKDENPILIVDRFGIIGGELLKELKDESLVVYVSQKQPDVSNNVVHIPFVKKVPTIPDNTYSHIFLLDDETNTIKDSLQTFIKKAKADDAAFMFATHMSKINEQFVLEIPNLYEKAKVVVYGDLFLRDKIYDNKTDVNKFIYQAKTYGRIEIPGDGTRETYPVFLDDVVSGIFEAVFGQGQKSSLFYVFPKFGVTLISLAHMLQKANPAVHIDFVKEKKIKQKNYVFSTLALYLLGENYPLENRIREINFTKAEYGTAEEDILKKSYKEKNYFFRKFVWLGFCLAFFLLLPLITTLGFSFLGLQSLKNAQSILEKNNYTAAESSVRFANTYFSIAKQASNVLLIESRIFGQQDKLGTLVNDINTGGNVSQAGIYLFSSSKYLSRALSDNSKNSTQDFINASNYLQNAFIIFDKEKAQGQNFYGITQKMEPLMAFVSNTMTVWPDLLGFDGTRTYLILFQNNMELRPGGGFIGSYGILTLNKGKISNFSIYDVYDADGQLKGHIEPPFPIRRYLPSVNWYLRDSNFDVDFINSASASAYFLNVEKGQRVNGVIGVDVSFVKNILAAMGQVYVPDYNEYVNSGNLFELTESHAEKNTFAGSTQKKDFLRSLFAAMKSDLLDKKTVSYLALAEALGQSIQEKHVLFAFDNSSIQNLFTVNGWSSSLWDDRKAGPSTIDDFLGISEANLGVNKANYFIKRSVSQVVNIDNNGDVNESVTVAYKNTDTSGVWPGGIYKDYLRFVLPEGTVINDIKINGEAQNTTSAITDPLVYENKYFKAPDKLEVYQYGEEGKTIYGFLTSVPVGALQTVTVDYTLSGSVDATLPEINYNLRYFKQPGTNDYPYSFSLTFPSGFRVISSSDGSTNSGREVYTTGINKDKNISVNLGQQ